MGALTHNGDVITGLPSTASQINYDNTSSGMAATQVQAAVDELNSVLNKAYTFNIDLTNKSLNTNYTVDLPSGFTADNSMIAGISLYKYNNVYSLTSILAESNLYLKVVILSTNKIQYTLQGNDTIAGRLRLLVYRIS